MLGMAKRVGAKFLWPVQVKYMGSRSTPTTRKLQRQCKPNRNKKLLRRGKRIAETLSFDYKRAHNLDIRVARIFNTYGPRMLPNDGRVVSNLIMQGLKNESMTLYGDGLQTRSFCYVDDLINGLIKLMNANTNGPINLGNPKEITILELAKIISKKLNISENFIFKDLPQDDPLQRKPIILEAKDKLNWSPLVDLDQGLENTINYFRNL